MSYKKFENSDLFYNTIKAKPRFQFKIWNGKSYVNNGSGLAILNGLQVVPGNELVQPSAPICQENALDFSCPENSQYIGVI